MLKSLAPAFLALSLASPALADEVWSSATGDIVYLADEYGAAILGFTDTYGDPGELIFPGLAGNFTDRGVHHGYWVGEGDLQCYTAMARPGGMASLAWGTATIAFDNPGFPTAFTLILGDCDTPADRSLRAEPRVGVP